MKGTYSRMTVSVLTANKCLVQPTLAVFASMHHVLSDAICCLILYKVATHHQEEDKGHKSTTEEEHGTHCH